MNADWACWIIRPRLGRHGGAQTNADEAQVHLVGDVAGQLRGEQRHNDAGQEGQDILGDHPAHRGAQAAGGQGVLPVTDDHDLGTEEVGNAQPAGHSQGEHEGPEA